MARCDFSEESGNLPSVRRRRDGYASTGCFLIGPLVQLSLRPPLVLLLGLLLAGGAAAADAEGIFMRTLADGSVELSNVPVEADYELLIAAPRLLAEVAEAAPGVLPPDASGKAAALLAGRVAQYRDLVATAAKEATVDARLLHAVIAVESGYNPLAVSAKGAVGLMQLMPDTAKRYGIRDARDPSQNLQAGARYLRDLLKLFNNDLNLTLAAYNAGENAVLRNGSRIPAYRETVAYVPRVLSVLRRLEGIAI
jgi:soluble lytic murein transglycosylase-like protein